MERVKSFLNLLQIDPEAYPVIAVVGGGGKTSLIFRLTEELVSLGKKVIVTTTTHMAWEPKRPFARDGALEDIRKNLDLFGYTLAAAYDEEKEKLAALPKERLGELQKLCDVVLIEADGAKRLPLKVPEEWEPVIPPCADLVISVVGLDCLGKPIREASHRMERTAEFLRKGLDAPVTEADVAKIASSICGLYKGVGDRTYRVYLNKTDVLPSVRPAQEIARVLEEKDTVAVYGSLL